MKSSAVRHIAWIECFLLGFFFCSSVRRFTLYPPVQGKTLTEAFLLGLVQLVLADMLIQEAGGPRLYEEVCRQAHIDPHTVFRIDKDYEDGQALKMFVATAEALGVEVPKVLAVFADAFVRDSLMRFPVFFEMSANSREFLERQPKVHGCLAMAVRGHSGGDAAAGKFEITAIPGGIRTRYRSRNRLAALYVALAERIIAHYEDDATVTVLDDITGTDCRIDVVWHDRDDS